MDHGRRDELMDPPAGGCPDACHHQQPEESAVGGEAP